jgi:hypothetical protein
MRTLRRFLRRLSSWAATERDEERLQAEIEEHLALQTAENVQAGLPPVEARRQALLKFGGVEATKESYRDRRGLLFMESFFKDMVQSLRVMRANPRFTLAAIAMLGLSIGANTTVVTLANAALFKGYPQVERNDRLLYLTLYPDCCVSYPTFEDWRAMARSFQGMAAVHDSRRMYSDGDGDDSPRTYPGNRSSS